MAFALTQSAQGQSASPASAVFATTPVAGSLLIATFKKNNQATASISDGGTAWTEASASPFNFNGTSNSMRMFYKIADSSQSKTVTTSGTGTHFLSIYEFSGGPASITGIESAIVAYSQGGSGTNDNYVGIEVTPPDNNCLIFASIATSSTITSPSWSATTAAQSNVAAGPIQLIDSYTVQTTAANIRPFATWTTSRVWGAITIALKGGTGTAPGMPTGLTVSADNEYRSRISWTAADATQTNFVLQRSTDHVTWTTVASPTAAHYIDTGLSATTTYYYQVAASNSYGTSSYASYQSCTTLATNSPWTARIEGWFFPTAAHSPVTEYTDGRTIYTLKPEYLHLNSSGAIEVRDTTFGTYGYSTGNAASVKAYSATQLITISCGVYADLQTMLNNSTTRAQAVTDIVSYISTWGFGGADIDFEQFASWGATEFTNFNTFMASLKSSLNALGMKLSVNVPAIRNSTYQASYPHFTYEGLYANTDYMCIMAYDYHWDNGAGQPISPNAYVTDIIDWTIGKLGWSNLDKIVIGIPSYSYHGTTGGFSLTEETYDESIGYTGFSGATRDTNSYEMMFTNAGVSYVYQDSSGLDSKRKLIEDKGILHVSVWHLGGNQWFTTTRAEQANPNKDSVAITDSVTKTVTKGIADVVITTDAPGRTSKHPLTDSVSTSDAISKRFTKNLSDSVAMSDHLSMPRTFHDFVVVNDRIRVYKNGLPIIVPTNDWVVRPTIGARHAVPQIGIGTNAPSVGKARVSAAPTIGL